MKNQTSLTNRKKRAHYILSVDTRDDHTTYMESVLKLTNALPNTVPNDMINYTVMNVMYIRTN